LSEELLSWKVGGTILFSRGGGERVRFEESLIVELIEKLILFKNFRKNSFFKELVGHTSLIIDLGGSV
jgi:hypothetical protein